VQTVVLTGTGFGKINSESLQIHYTCSCLGRHLPVQQPGIDHSCVNQVVESSNLQFFGSHLSEKSPCIADKQVNILDVAAVHRHNCWSWYFYMNLLLPITLPHLWFGQFTNKYRNETDFAVLLAYNSRNIHRFKVSGIFLWKSHFASFSNYV